MASLKEIAREYELELTTSPKLLPDSSEFESERVVAVWKQGRSWHAETIEFFQSDAAYEIEHVLNRAADVIALDENAVAFGPGAACDFFDADDSITKIAAIIAETYARRDPECALREWQFSMRDCMWEIEQQERRQYRKQEMKIETNSEPDGVIETTKLQKTAPEEITEQTSEISVEERQEQTDSESNGAIETAEPQEYTPMEATTKTQGVRGFKVFNPDWTCRGKQYACPGKFEEDVKLKICERGMHFCERLIDCLDYYSFNPKNKIAEVVAYGAVVTDGCKNCTDKLEVVREISWHEALDLVNTGKNCTGIGNSGGSNSGNRNSGGGNSGNRNSGNENSGNENSGNWNSGDFNACSGSSGCFNTEEAAIRFFNQPSDWTLKDWRNSAAYRTLSAMPTDSLQFIYFHDMTESEKAAHPKAETTGGYLKKVKATAEDRQKWWDRLSCCDKAAILEIPNFNAAIFKRITGIDVNKKDE